MLVDAHDQSREPGASDSSGADSLPVLALDEWGLLGDQLILHLDAEGKCLHAAASAEWLLGYDPQALVGTKLCDLAPWDGTGEAPHTAMLAEIQSAGWCEGRQLVMRDADGRPHRMHCRGALLAALDGQDPTFLVAATDVDRLKAAASREGGEIDVAERAADPDLVTAVGRAVHRLNNHLTALSCRCDLASAGAIPEGALLNELTVYRQLIDSAVGEVQALSRACLNERRANQ